VSESHPGGFSPIRREALFEFKEAAQCLPSESTEGAVKERDCISPFLILLPAFLCSPQINLAENASVEPEKMLTDVPACTEFSSNVNSTASYFAKSSSDV
jgi:hypothetical protein